MDEQTFWDLVGTIGPDPGAFDRLADELSDRGPADIRAATGCELGIVTQDRMDHLRPSADIRKVRDKVGANFTCSPPQYDSRPADLLPVAVDEVTGMFEVIRQAIGLPQLPPVPALPALPDEAWEVEVTTRAQPAEPREQPGYLTLAQIQEFFC